MKSLTRVIAIGMSALLCSPILTSISLPSSPANALVIKPFTASYNAQINGGVIFAQNTSLSCDGTLADGTQDERGCSNTKNGGKSLVTNNAWRMNHVDVDSDPQTFNSSTSQLSLPNNVTVVYAALYWGARLKGTNGLANAASTYDRVKLRTPGSTSYVDVVAQPGNIIVAPGTSGVGEPYQAKAIVTDLVKAGGAGNYTVANLAAGLGVDRYAGWTLAVVFQDPSRPLRDITLFDGLVNVRSTDQPETITVSGFTAPVQGAVDATVGLVAYDGDRANTGDFADFNTSRLASTVSPANDYFNSTIDTFGQNVLTRSPADQNTLGFDVKVADATGLIGNSDNSADITVGTKGESVIVGLISTRIDLRAPRFPSVKSVVNTNGNSPAQIGDTLRYELSFTNTGDDPADRFVLTDPIPTGTTYVAGSLKINDTTVTDSLGDDSGEISADGRSVIARLGTGANSTTGGRMTIGSTHTVSFEATVNAGTEGQSLTNTGAISYLAATLQEQIDSATNSVSTQVFSPAGPPPTNVTAPQLEAAVVMPERVIPGSTSNGQLVVKNVGSSSATSVVMEYPIPGEIVVTSTDPRCTQSNKVVRCSVNLLDSGDSAVFGFVFTTVDEPSSEQFTSTATATATGATAVTASAKTNISVDADLVIRKRLTETSTTRATFTMTVINKGPGTAKDVVITDALPIGMDFVSSELCVPDSANDHVLNCELGNIKDGKRKSAVVTVALTINAPLTNEASVSYAGLDRTPNNNVSTASTGILPATGTTNSAYAVIALLLMLSGVTVLGLRRRKL
jgi:uncharacterized repeat protein (TIGR01451 family)/LPXTG-motif cell wall-anchored protein